MSDAATRIVQVPVNADGTIDLPPGAVVVTIDFEDEGGLGSNRRPAAVWAVVPDRE